jgi:glyoxylase-like metal-dependent hydrolase (beta-lactamase superfamily II)
MRPVDEIQRVNDRLVFWQGYEPAAKVDLSSHACLTAQGWVLVDPIPLRDEVLAEFCGREKVAAIVLTNANHKRAAADYQKKTGARIFAHEGARGEFPAGDVQWIKWIKDAEQVCGLEAIHLPGFVAGEIALHSPEDGGIMLMGDALVNLESTGFALLPDKYCDNPKAARESAQKLLQFSFELMTFAHGLPIIAGAKRRLKQLLP